jgi:uncharacterized repeat protein (TIGR01451 family)
MKRQYTLRQLAATALAVLFALGGAQFAHAEDNTGTGDIAGDSNALTDSNTFQLFSTGATLALVKTAFLSSTGAQLGTGTTVPQGTGVDFMIYVNNNSSVSINDVSIQDVLDPLFAYQAGSIRVDNSSGNCAAAACTPAEEAAIYAAATASAASSDAVDADTAAYDGTDTVDVGDQAQANAQQDVAANSVLAVVFTVQVQ